ncbi:phosphotransferase family protein [Actinomadura sp. 6N118]|uniref:phosphotransferase family protein n=1 Tax=Actinomadura sp. 6N118 TaxID=3375151 RepID=UPI0037BAC7DD
MGRDPSPPPATGVRVSWWQAPERLRGAIEAHLGGKVAESRTQPGGFSPGVAARLRLDDGRRVFVKAAGEELNADTPGLHRAEARVAAVIPASAPVPSFLTSFDQDGWVALLFEDIDGQMPRQPWDPDELRRVLDALSDLAEVMTPSPIDVPTAGERFAEAFRGWRTLAGGEDASGLDPWAVRHLGRLAELEETWADAAAGTTLAHADIRADNLLLTADRVVVVDWPWASLAAPWFDLLGMLPSVRMQGGPPPEQIFDAHPAAARADDSAVTAVLVALAGYFVWSGRQPDPSGLPTLRAFQQAQGEIALTWLRRRTGW